MKRLILILVLIGPLILYFPTVVSPSVPSITRSFPTFVTTSGGNVTTNAINGTGLLQMPSGIVAGNLLIAIVCGNIDGNVAGGVFSSAVGWTLITQDANADNNLDTAAYRRNATGTEGTQQYFQGSPTWYKTSNIVTYQVYRITGNNQSQAPVGVTSVGSSSANPDPLVLTPPWGADNTTWIATVCTTEKNTSPFILPTITALPANYLSIRPRDKWDQTGFQTSQIQGTFRNLTAASENPGAFTLSGTVVKQLAMTLGIRHALHVTPPTPFDWGPTWLIGYISLIILLFMGAVAIRKWRE